MPRDPSLAPVGVYDSGVGGISVLRALRKALPHESYVYIADSRHAPYGDRSQRFLQARARQVVGFLAALPVKAVVLACNTVSVVAATSLRAEFPLPIVAMEPAIKPATRGTRSGTVLVLATASTVRSRAVARLCSAFGGNVRIILQGCPGLAERVERGELASPATVDLLRAYLRPGLEAGADTIVLGCTHYAFLKAQIARLAGPTVAIIEPSEAVALQLERRIGTAQRAPTAAAASTVFYASGNATRLQSFLALIGETPHAVRAMPGDA
ncbi:MAG: glutamate racemase [Candidatus Levyibacteriota bacterium]